MVERRHFEEGGADYQRHRPSYPLELVQALVSECASTYHALDVGCGTGQLSILLAEHFNLVTATDPSETQISNAVPRDNARYRCEPAEKISLRDGCVDLVVAAQAAHWFDLPSFYAEVKRVLHPKGVLALVAYGVPTLDGAIGQRFSDFYWKEIHKFWPEERRHVENGYRTMGFPFEERPLPPLSIERNWSFDDLVGYVSTWSAARRAREANAETIITRFTKELAELWGTQNDLKKICWPITGRVGGMNVSNEVGSKNSRTAVG
ncbi:class I SAM-dependent methyltransferase [Notoacmeibacter marinus]|uniref:class I SAM-dependent methyltransferase n=1 Tax=Notoacmeibacter marinus TaxID=1876515 RepID=UPI000DF16B84|nr:class I SAM-dependent methyltransferase [Notoacmeibacter marinus]